MTVADAVATPRVHNQWLPDQVFVEPGVPDAVVAALQARGDKVVAQPPFTSANSIAITPGGFVGAADPRRGGATAVGY
jgi:gamma-glutamyltranspeptidase/glutathione hydrolase